MSVTVVYGIRGDYL